MINVSQLELALKQFAQERDWEQFHSPKNIVMALTGEVGELNEIFQWMPEAESWQAANVPETANHIREELADVLMYLVRLSSVLGVDLDEAVKRKLALNALKYPAELVRSSSKKAVSTGSEL